MITQNMNFKMLNDEIVKVTVSEAGVMMNDATVIIPDIIASNGVIHAIDAVLIPPSETEPTAPDNQAPTKQPTSSADSIYDIAKSSSDFTTLGE